VGDQRNIDRAEDDGGRNRDLHADQQTGVPDVPPVKQVGGLVGRARELAAITSAMRSVLAGVQRSVHLVGEPGIGKTALAEHAAALARGRGWVVAWGRAWDPQGAPYWLWQQVLSAIVGSTTVVSRCHPGTLAWLTDLVPELGDVAPPVPAGTSAEQARAAMQGAVVHVLARYSRKMGNETASEVTVASFEKDGTEWKGLLSSELEQLAARLRAQFLKPQ
jgi:hypothetical protein